jgi:uncharacterized C2H2 Zn-finger protein
MKCPRVHCKESTKRTQNYNSHTNKKKHVEMNRPTQEPQQDLDARDYLKNGRPERVRADGAVKGFHPHGNILLLDSGPSCLLQSFSFVLENQGHL